VDHPPPAVRLDTRMSDVNLRTNVPSLLNALFICIAIYMHCGGLGQAKCGGNWAFAAAGFFKLAFEIDTARKSTIVNHR
jgi:hypothetical protein